MTKGIVTDFKLRELYPFSRVVPQPVVIKSGFNFWLLVGKHIVLIGRSLSVNKLMAYSKDMSAISLIPLRVSYKGCTIILLTLILTLFCEAVMVCVPAITRTLRIASGLTALPPTNALKLQYLRMKCF